MTGCKRPSAPTEIPAVMAEAHKLLGVRRGTVEPDAALGGVAGWCLARRQLGSRCHQKSSFKASWPIRGDKMLDAPLLLLSAVIWPKPLLDTLGPFWMLLVLL